MASISLTEDGFEVDRSDFRFEALDKRLIERTLPDVIDLHEVRAGAP